MSTYKPTRKISSGTEEVQFPMSAIEGLEDNLEGKISSISINAGPEDYLSLIRDAIVDADCIGKLCVVYIGGYFNATLIGKTSWAGDNRYNFDYLNVNTSAKVGGNYDITTTTIKTLLDSATSLATVDKIKKVTVLTRETIDPESDDVGIYWTEDVIFTDEKSNTLAKAIISQHVPIAAGDNVTLTVDEENQVIKISAEGGSGATVDKIQSIDTYVNGVDFLYCDDVTGIVWEDIFEFNSGAELDGEVRATGRIYHRIPIIAGNGIELEADQQVVKINATGGGSVYRASSVDELPSDATDGSIGIVELPDPVLGTWYLNTTVQMGYFAANIDFTSNGESFTSLACYGSLSYDATTAFSSDDGWTGEGYRYLTITRINTADIDVVSNWLNANGEHTEAPSVYAYYVRANGAWLCMSEGVNGGVHEDKMPQIRFTSVAGETGYYNRFATGGSFIVAEYDEYGEINFTYPLYFTVEVVSGSLQVGDQLQLCRRTTFMGSEANDYRRKKKLKRVTEYVVTEDDLDKRFLTVAADVSRRQEHKALLHDEYGNGGSSFISPLYLRIRRPKGKLQNNNSQQTVDAEFSNVETIWKQHHRGAGQVIII